MANDMLLFDVKPYTQRRRAPRPGMPQNVRDALERLRVTLDAIPEEERRRRYRRWRDTFGPERRRTPRAAEEAVHN